MLKLAQKLLLLRNEKQGTFIADKIWYRKQKFLRNGIISLLVGVGLQPLPIKAEATVETQQLISQSTDIYPINQSQLELLSLGAYPKQELRFQPTVNTRETIKMTMLENIFMPVSESSAYTLTSPGIAVTIDLLVTQVDTKGDIHCNFSYKSLDVSENASSSRESFDSLQMKYKNLKGFKGSVTFNNHGQIIKTSLDQPQNIEPPLTYALDKMRVFVEQLPLHFPKQAVGKGAKWRVTSAVNVDKIAFTQIATYELVDFKDGVATFNISLQQLPQQPVPSEGTRNLPQLSQDSLYSQQYQSSGSGIAVIELNKLAPRNFKTSMRSDTYLSKKITNGSKRQAVIILRELSLQSQ